MAEHFRDLPVGARFHLTDRVFGRPAETLYTKRDGLGALDAEGYCRIHPDAVVISEDPRDGEIARLRASLVAEVEGVP